MARFNFDLDEGFAAQYPPVRLSSAKAKRRYQVAPRSDKEASRLAFYLLFAILCACLVFSPLVDLLP